MITLSNGLSVIRMPLSFLFLSHNIYVRLVAILLAMITDSIDGYFARKYKSASKFGAFLDPAMDKFFVYFALCVFVVEHQLRLPFALAMISRDFALILFVAYLAATKRFSTYVIRPARWGKVTTGMQFLVLIGLTFKYPLSPYIYSLFTLFGVFALIELFTTATYKKLS